ncbi:MAG: phospholipid carrier-dependent glycosyltransferase [Chitinivibrionales bacterium]|nr:phospholipid carrier-dependent glycosyltransferase [Chitinivibrionales bacterium]
MVAIVLLLISASAIGNYLLSRIRITENNRLAHGVLACAAGLGIWCYCLLVLGYAGMLNKWAFLALAVVTSIPAVRSFFRKKQWQHMLKSHNPLSRFELTVLLIFFVVAAVTLVCCYAPVVGGIGNDEIGIHITVPHEWLRDGRISSLPYMVHHLAGHAELLFAYAMAFSGETGARLMSWTFMLLCSLLIYSMAERKTGRPAALLASAFVVVNPLIFRTSFIGFIDFPATFYILLSMWRLMRFSEKKEFKEILLSAIFLGIACGVKPTGLFYALTNSGFLVLIMARYHRENPFPIVKYVMIFCAVTAVLGSPWIVRNLLLTGSPTFPPPLFIYRLNNYEPLTFAGQQLTFDNAKEYMDYYPSRVRPYGLGIKNYFLLPWNITIHPESFSIGDSVGTLILSFIPLVFLFGRRPRWVNAILMYSFLAATVLYFLIIPEARYLVGVFMLLSIVCAWVAFRLFARYPTGIITAAVIGTNMAFSLAVLGRICLPQLKSVASSRYRHEYRKKHTPFFEAFSWLNRRDSEKIVVPYASQVFYYLDDSYIVDSDALNEPSKHRGAYLLDIDYSQTLGRSFENQRHEYTVDEEDRFLTLVFDGPDARIYKFKD